VDAQFSMPYGVAIALIDRAAGLDQFSDDSVRSPEIKSLMGKVVLTKDMRIEKNFPEEWPARVQIELTNGKQFKKNIRFPKGDPENPMTWRDLTIKFESLATRVISDARAGQIVGAVSAMKPSSLPGDIWKMTAGGKGSQYKTAN
jgi:2-methylcitrate dehydratase PrpD